MRIESSTIVSFLTGRLYSTTPPTVLFANLCKSILGVDRGIFTHEMPFIKDEYSDAIFQQLPNELQSIIINWQHTPDWQSRIDLIDETFGQIEISSVNH